MFDFLKKKDKGIEIGAPVKGKAVPISQVSDPTFGEEILGKGVAIQPADGKIYAPADGTIEMLFDTKHAVSMTTTEGVELLVHIGLDMSRQRKAPFLPRRLHHSRESYCLGCLYSSSPDLGRGWWLS